MRALWPKGLLALRLRGAGATAAEPRLDSRPAVEWAAEWEWAAERAAERKLKAPKSDVKFSWVFNRTVKC